MVLSKLLKMLEKPELSDEWLDFCRACRTYAEKWRQTRDEQPATEKPKLRIVFIGPRGGGKTQLCAAIRAAVEQEGFESFMNDHTNPLANHQTLYIHDRKVESPLVTFVLVDPPGLDIRPPKQGVIRKGLQNLTLMLGRSGEPLLVHERDRDLTEIVMRGNYFRSKNDQSVCYQTEKGTVSNESGLLFW